MKKSVAAKWLSGFLALTFLVTMAAGCAKKPAGGSSTADASSAGGPMESAGDGDTSRIDSELVSDSSLPVDASGVVSGAASMGTVSKGSGTSNTVKNDWDKDWAGSKPVVQDLGDIILEDFPVDYSYDWGHCVLKIGDTYKLWFTRQSPWDGVWYAESKDLKHWTKLQCIAKINSIEDYKTYVKQHIADPAVVYVNGTYHFWFETNMTVDEKFEAYGGNAIIYATSKDGIHLNWYQNSEKEGPLPVMKPTGANVTNGSYGTGMPSVIYKDGKFMMYYYDGSVDSMRLAVSTDGKTFPVNEKNPIVMNRAGIGFAYNSLTGKFMATLQSNPQLADPKAKDVDVIYYVESDDGISWPYKTMPEVAKNGTAVSPADTTKVVSFSEFVRNQYGMIDTPTFYVTWSSGKRADAGQGWMQYAQTFDGHIAAVNPTKFAKRTIDLPNSKPMSAANLKAYADSTVKWNTRSSTAKKGTPTIDGKKDAIWDKTAVLTVDRPAPVSGMYPTKTTGKVQLLWDENNLYLYAEITDAKVSYSYPIKKLADMYHRDSLAVFIDVPRDRSKPANGYTPKQYCYSACANGDDVVMNPTINQDISREFKKKSVVTKTKTGYTIEASVSWHDLVKSEVKAGKMIGLDIGINDDLGNGDREACVSWSDYEGNAFRDYTKLGNVTLVG